ncbi:hypothetical protein ACVIWU_002594 [Bradyrhizobium sp. USDA 4509]
MMKWRKESALDLYNLIAAIFLLAALWLFVRANPTAAIDLRISGAAIAIMSLAAIVVLDLGRMDQPGRRMLADRLALAARLHAYPRDAFCHRRRRGGGIHGAARAVARIREDAFRPGGAAGRRKAVGSAAGETEGCGSLSLSMTSSENRFALFRIML